MKTLDLPAAAPAMANLSNPAELAPNSNGKAPAQNFDELMGQAMATNDSATESANSETPVEKNASADSADKTKASEPASAAAVEMIAAMILPAVLPMVALTTTASSSAQDVIAAVGGESGSQENGVAADGASSETTADANALTTPAPVSILPAAVPQVVTPNSAATSNTASATAATSPNTKAPVEMPLAELVTPSTRAATPIANAPVPDANTSLPSDTIASAEATSDLTISQPADATNDQPSDAPVSAEQKLPPENISTANQLLARNSASAEMIAKATEAVETTVDPDAAIDPATLRANSISAAGTSGAKYRSPMQKAEKQNEIAESAEQNLPAGASSVAANGNAKTVRAFNSTPESDKSDASGISASNVTDSFGGKEVNALPNSAAPVSPTRAVERTQDLMALHAFRLRDSGQDSMQVVIKPSPDLHLALNLRMRDGQMEVTANLQRGDFEFLNRHWTDLQQQLEARGVRLAPLSNNETTASSGNFSQHSGRQSSEEKAAKTGAFAEFALASVLAPKRPLKFANAPQGWESWA